MTVNAIRALQLVPATHRLCANISSLVSKAAMLIRNMLDRRGEKTQELLEVRCTWRPSPAADIFVFLDPQSPRPLVGLAMQNEDGVCTGIKYYEPPGAFDSGVVGRGSFVLLAQLTIDQNKDNEFEPVLLVYDGYDPATALPPAPERYKHLLRHQASIEHARMGNARCKLQWVGDGRYADRVSTMTGLPHATDGLLIVRDCPPHSLVPATCEAIGGF